MAMHITAVFKAWAISFLKTINEIEERISNRIRIEKQRFSENQNSQRVKG